MSKDLNQVLFQMGKICGELRRDVDQLKSQIESRQVHEIFDLGDLGPSHFGLSPDSSEEFLTKFILALRNRNNDFVEVILDWPIISLHQGSRYLQTMKDKYYQSLKAIFNDVRVKDLRHKIRLKYFDKWFEPYVDFINGLLSQPPQQGDNNE